MPVPLTPGLVIDGFELIAPLHEGGMATLWRVAHPDHAMPLLMKLARIGYGEAATQIVGFEVERMILPQLRGPHVPRFVAAGDHHDQPWLVMEHLAGDTLRPLLDSAPLPPQQVAELGALAATAIHALHQQEVIHLDIKPSNLLRRPDGSVALIDFGLSHHAHLPDLLDEQFRVPIGTAPYIAPEQVLGVRDEPRSDLFALGVTLYHLATGERPFGNPGSPAGLRRRLYRDPVPPRALRPEIPRWLQEVILRCLEVDPDARHATAAQLAHDLQHPEQVPLTARADRSHRDGRVAVIQRWWKNFGREREPRRAVTDHLDQAPLLMVAVDLKHEDAALCAALRGTLQRIVSTFPHSRLACITVMRTARIGLDSNLDSEGRNRHVKRLIALRDWVRPLGLDEHRITVHVLEHSDPAHALLDYARDNGVDHLIMGARGVTGVRRILGSVSARVVAEAPCTVTVVRAPAAHDGDAEEPA
ncbi:bifunctional serine/threonine-protein kinase/universal stress protein [Lysobacter hankyongensis]|uniref:Bifunctional serine/threonine-protein kinase/universal stress protein n=1 Tax=Lysobacter hankyongensis TaxID=1176535 RepID=A0ABP9B7M0_9GAMM